MKLKPVELNSKAHDAWHEVGHAVACLHFGGDVVCIEYLENHDIGRARARCQFPDHISRQVFCGGFAAEWLLHERRLFVDTSPADFEQQAFKNATIDRERFFNLELGVDQNEFSDAQDIEFRDYAIQIVAPALRDYIFSMQNIVDDFISLGRLSGNYIREWTSL